MRLRQGLNLLVCDQTGSLHVSERLNLDSFLYFSDSLFEFGLHFLHQVFVDKLLGLALSLKALNLKAQTVDHRLNTVPNAQGHIKTDHSFLSGQNVPHLCDFLVFGVFAVDRSL